METQSKEDVIDWDEVRLYVGVAAIFVVIFMFGMFVGNMNSKLVPAQRSAHHERR